MDNRIASNNAGDKRVYSVSAEAFLTSAKHGSLDSISYIALKHSRSTHATGKYSG